MHPGDGARANGGLELSLADNALIIQAAKANGSLGWILLVGIPGPVILGLLPPELVLPAPGVDFLDMWHVLGLRATASCDYAVRDVFVPE